MFMFKLSSWLDLYDPYWYSRLIALKASYLTIILFIANLLLQPPLASLIMLISGVGVIVIETPSINELRKKDALYIVYVILICITIGIFSTYVYFKMGFIIAVCGWTFILYSALKSKPEVLPIVSIVLMLAIVSLEGINTGNFYIILNLLGFIVKFSAIVFIAHKLFPNFYDHIWQSGILRNLEAIQESLAKYSLDNPEDWLKHFWVCENSLELIRPEKYADAVKVFNQQFNYYQYYLIYAINNHDFTRNDMDIISLHISNLYLAILKQKRIPGTFIADSHNYNLIPHLQNINKLAITWNQVCLTANS